MRNRALLPFVAAAATVGALLWRRTTERRQGAERLAAATLEALLHAIDANDEMTGAHVRRVAEYSLVLGGAAGLDEHVLRQVERVALFHDIGKIHAALFDIVHDDEGLTEEERRSIATHPQRGADVLAPLAAFYPELADGVLAHHERWDGAGYPHGLHGLAIPLAARIVAIADTFDAVTHTRRYRRGACARKGADVIAEGRGTQFDPTLTDIFLAPATFARIERILDESRAPDAPRTDRVAAPMAGRRRRSLEKQVPEVSFRWREESDAGAPRGAGPAPADAPALRDGMRPPHEAGAEAPPA